MLQKMKAIQDEEHLLQKEALSIRLKIEQLDSHIAEHQGKIRYWQKEVIIRNRKNVFGSLC